MKSCAASHASKALPCDQTANQWNYTIAQELYEDAGNIEALFTTFWRLPLLYLTLMVVRFVCIAIFNPLFQLTNAGELYFIGQVALITA